MKQIRSGLARDQRKSPGNDAGEGQHVRQPDEPKGGAAKRDGQQATVSPDDGVRRGQHEDHGQGDDHGHVQRRHVPGQRQGAVGQQCAKNGDQQEDGHAQQNQQAATVDSAQARHHPIAGGGQHRGNRHARNMHGTPGKRS